MVETKQDGSVLKNFVYGTVAGMLGKLVEHPFDTLKVRMQTQNTFKTADAAPKLFSGPLDALGKTLKYEGIVGLYRGLPSPLVGAMFENAVLFSVFGYCKDTIRKFGIHKGSDSDMPLKYVALSGGIAGAFASIVLSPVELVKCLVQVESLRDGGYSESRNSDGKSKRQVNNTFKMFKAVVNNQGLRGLYQGFVWTFIRETGGGAVWFCTYEYLKRSFPQNDNSPLQIVIAGGIAGIAYNFSFFPADVIKSLHQTHINPFVSSQNPMNNFNWRTEVVKLYRSGGIRPFYAGISVTLLKAFPGNATIFIMYETLKKWFG